MTREEVLEAIRTRHAQGQPVVGLSSTCPDLYRAARNGFGSWRNAVLAAGVPIRVPQRWTDERVLEKVRFRFRQGPPLWHVWRDDKPLFRAATRRFGNWNNALLAAGLDIRPPRRWSAQRVLDDLRLQYRHGQFHIRVADKVLADAAARYFGSLNNALEAAGLPPRPGRWTRRQIIDTIQDFYVRGKPIEFVGFKDKRLAQAAKRYFGTWRAAVAAAGLDDRLPKAIIARRWSQQMVIAEIQEWHRQGAQVTTLWDRDPTLYSAAKKQFGNWRSAVLAAGFEPGLRAWTRQLVLQEIQSRHQQGLAISTMAAFREASALAGAATRLFGSWKKALQAAGIREASLADARRPPKNRRSA
ncbi:MAG: hypothetical protein WD845_06620 [Pirellulales bacterium]